MYFQTCPKSGLVDNSAVISPAGRLLKAACAMIIACFSVIFGLVSPVGVT
jgi:hypothetical protein